CYHNTHDDPSPAPRATRRFQERSRAGRKPAPSARRVDLSCGLSSDRRLRRNSQRTHQQASTSPIRAGAKSGCLRQANGRNPAELPRYRGPLATEVRVRKEVEADDFESVFEKASRIERICQEVLE